MFFFGRHHSGHHCGRGLGHIHGCLYVVPGLLSQEKVNVSIFFNFYSLSQNEISRLMRIILFKLSYDTVWDNLDFKNTSLKVFSLFKKIKTLNSKPSLGYLCILPEKKKT